MPQSNRKVSDSAFRSLLNYAADETLVCKIPVVLPPYIWFIEYPIVIWVIVECILHTSHATSDVCMGDRCYFDRHLRRRKSPYSCFEVEE